MPTELHDFISNQAKLYEISIKITVTQYSQWRDCMLNSNMIVLYKNWNLSTELGEGHPSIIDIKLK